MQNIRIRIDHMLDALSGVSSGTWVRLVLFIISWGMVAVALFLSPTHMLLTIVALTAAIVVTVWTAWKNNSFTHLKQRADKLIKNAGFSRLLFNISKVSAATWTRVAFLIIALINLCLTAANKPVIKIENEELYTIVSYGLAILVGFINYITRNSFTEAAQAADNYIHSQKHPENLSRPLCIDEAFELIEAFMNKEQYSSNEYNKFKDVVTFLLAYFKDNPNTEIDDKLKAILKNAIKVVDQVEIASDRTSYTSH